MWPDSVPPPRPLFYLFQVLRKPASLDALKKLAQLVHGAGPDRARTTHVSVAIAETA